MVDPKNTYDPLQKKIDYKFNDLSILRQSLRHKSISYDGDGGYERMEFLGDRVLGFVISNLLYHAFPEEREGSLAKRFSALVRGETCCLVAQKIDLGQYVQMAKSEEEYGGRESESLLADCCEALIAAIFLDGGIEKAQKFILRYWTPFLNNQETLPEDPKTALQEWAQARSKNLPEYKIVNEEGPSHDKRFTMIVCLDGHQSSPFTDGSKKKAQRKAAKDLLKKLRQKK